MMKSYLRLMTNGKGLKRCNICKADDTSEAGSEGLAGIGAIT